MHPDGKNFNIGSTGLNNCWNSGEEKLPLPIVTSAWIIEENDSQYWMGRCNKPFIQLPFCMQLLVEIGDHSFSSTVQILWEDLLSNSAPEHYEEKVLGENNSHPRRKWWCDAELAAIQRYYTNDILIKKVSNIHMFSLEKIEYDSCKNFWPLMKSG